MAYKVFTNGSTLQASELNENLMQQSIAVFSNASARTAAITSPVEGQMTYLEDTNRYASWDGSAWVSPFAVVPLVNTSFSGQTNVSISNVFSSSFDSYKVFITTNPAAGNPLLLYRYRDGSGDVGSTLYTYQTLIADNTTVVASRATNNLSVAGQLTAGFLSGIEMTLYNPNLAERTITQSTCASGVAGGFFRQDTSTFDANTQFTGISFFPASSSISGRIRIYGLRNS